MPNRAESDRVPVLYNHIRAWHDGLSCGEQRGLLYIIHLQPECKSTGPLLTASLFTGAVGHGNATSHSCSSHAIWNSIPNDCLWSSEWRKSRYGINYVLDFINLSILMKTRNKILSAVEWQNRFFEECYCHSFPCNTVACDAPLNTMNINCMTRASYSKPKCTLFFLNRIGEFEWRGWFSVNDTQEYQWKIYVI